MMDDGDNTIITIITIIIIILTSGGGEICGGGCDVVPSKTITSFLISSAVSKIELMSDACTMERYFSCFDAFLEYTSVRRVFLFRLLECCSAK